MYLQLIPLRVGTATNHKNVSKVSKGTPVASAKSANGAIGHHGASAIGVTYREENQKEKEQELLLIIIRIAMEGVTEEMK